MMSSDSAVKKEEPRRPVICRRKLHSNPSYRSKFFRFPEKLWKVVNDGIVIKWTADGTGIVIEEDQFEAQVMALYPGFVQVGTFHNLRRLLRDYGFDFIVLRKRKQKANIALKIEYRHPYFTRKASLLDLYKIFKIKTDADLESRNNILATFTNEGVMDSGCQQYKLKRYRRCRLRLIEKFYGNDRPPSEQNNLSLEDSFLSEVDFERLGLEPDTSFFFGENATFRQSVDAESEGLQDQRKSLKDCSLRCLQIYGRRELDDVDFAELMHKQLPEHREQMTLEQWDATLLKVNDLVSSELLPSPGTGMYVPIAFEDL